MKEKKKSILHGRAHFYKSSRITSGTLSKGGEAASSASNNPFGIRWGTIFIVGFRSRRSRGRKDRRQRSHEAPEGGPHAAKESGRVGLCLLAFGHPLFLLLRSYAFFLPKIDTLKFLGHLDVVWVPETKKYRK